MQKEEINAIASAACEDILLVAKKWSFDQMECLAKEAFGISFASVSDAKLRRRIELELISYLIDCEVRFFSAWVPENHTDRERLDRLYRPREVDALGKEFLYALLSCCTKGSTREEFDLVKSRIDEYAKCTQQFVVSEEGGKFDQTDCHGFYMATLASLAGTSYTSHFETRFLGTGSLLLCNTI